MSQDTTTIPETITELSVLSHLLHFHVTEGHAFSLWRKPGEEEKHLLVCASGASWTDEVTLEDTATGFVFAPFDKQKKKLFLKGDYIYSFQKGTFTSKEPPPLFPQTDPFQQNTVRGKMPIHRLPAKDFPDSTDAHFRGIVEKSIAGVVSGTFEKVVPSRTKHIPLPADFDALLTFEKLCRQYPLALVSVVSTPETGTWIGATPELLVSIDDKMKFRTVALAGTQRLQPGTDLRTVAWTQKDIEEQALVCRYIINCFKKIRLREYQEHGPKTSVAGNLIHLRTDYEVDMVATNFPQLGSVMLNLLHPTSAVCGMPLEPATAFLKAHEGYDREYYSGFLGPVNFRNESHIYVNLRCMNVHQSGAILYAGAGVTADSNPQLEWEETEMKMNTLLQVIGISS